MNTENAGRRGDTLRFQQIVEMAPNALLMVNGEGCIALVNAQTEAMFGYARAELIGQTIEMLVPQRLRGAHPRFRDAFLASPNARPMGAGRDLFAMRKDGSEFPVEIGLNPVQTDAGTMVLGSIVDISVRKRAEERTRLIVESAPNAILMVARDGVILLVNSQAESLFGYSRAELLGKAVEQLVPERFRHGHPQTRANFFRSPMTRSMGVGRDLYGLRKDGTEMPIEIGLNPIHTADDGDFVLASIIDITERKRAERRIQAALAEKTALLKEIHHRVKNNLQVISSLLSLQSSHSAEPGTRSRFAEAQNRVKAMAMIHQLLYERDDLSHIDVREYMERLRDHLATIYSNDHARVAFSVVAEGGPLILDLHRAVPCGLVVVELVSNAYKHAFPGGRSGSIRVRLAMISATEALLAVEDDGIGMSPDREQARGTGLGLELVPLLADQLQATLIRPAFPGTRIELRFPVEVRAESSA